MASTRQLEVNHYEGDRPTKKRAYVKIEEWEPHKELVLRMRHAKAREKDILTVLRDERGFMVEMHQLKKVLQIWGSKRNLKKKQRDFIVKTVKERKQAGKTKTIFHHPGGTIIEQAEVKEIMRRYGNSEPVDAPSPGGLVVGTPGYTGPSEPESSSNNGTPGASEGGTSTEGPSSSSPGSAGSPPLPFHVPENYGSFEFPIDISLSTLSPEQVTELSLWMQFTNLPPSPPMNSIMPQSIDPEMAAASSIFNQNLWFNVPDSSDQNMVDQYLNLDPQLPIFDQPLFAPIGSTAVIDLTEESPPEDMVMEFSAPAPPLRSQAAPGSYPMAPGGRMAQSRSSAPLPVSIPSDPVPFFAAPPPQPQMQRTAGAVPPPAPPVQSRPAARKRSVAPPKPSAASVVTGWAPPPMTAEKGKSTVQTSIVSPAPVITQMPPMPLAAIAPTTASITPPAPIPQPATTTTRTPVPQAKKSSSRSLLRKVPSIFWKSQESTKSADEEPMAASGAPASTGAPSMAPGGLIDGLASPTPARAYNAAPPPPPPPPPAIVSAAPIVPPAAKPSRRVTANSLGALFRMGRMTKSASEQRESISAGVQPFRGPSVTQFPTAGAVPPPMQAAFLPSPPPPPPPPMAEASPPLESNTEEMIVEKSDERSFRGHARGYVLDNAPSVPDTGSSPRETVPDFKTIQRSSWKVSDQRGDESDEEEEDADSSDSDERIVTRAGVRDNDGDAFMEEQDKRRENLRRRLSETNGASDRFSPVSIKLEPDLESDLSSGLAMNELKQEQDDSDDILIPFQVLSVIDREENMPRQETYSKEKLRIETEDGSELLVFGSLEMERVYRKYVEDWIECWVSRANRDKENLNENFVTGGRQGYASRTEVSSEEAWDEPLPFHICNTIISGATIKMEFNDDDFAQALEERVWTWVLRMHLKLLTHMKETADVNWTLLDPEKQAIIYYLPNLKQRYGTNHLFTLYAVSCLGSTYIWETLGMQKDAIRLKNIAFKGFASIGMGDHGIGFSCLEDNMNWGKWQDHSPERYQAVLKRATRYYQIVRGKYSNTSPIGAYSIANMIKAVLKVDENQAVRTIPTAAALIRSFPWEWRSKPDILYSTSQLGDTMCSVGMTVDATRLMTEVLRSGGSFSDPTTAKFVVTLMQSIVNSYAMQEKWLCVLDYRRSLLEFYKNKYGWDHPYTLISINKVTQALESRGLQIYVLPSLKAEWMMARRIYGDNDEKTREVFWKYGRAVVGRGLGYMQH
ncbi:hypothetical protein ABW19_dt0201877 [Dactylella cylindrospora]|nr:hypothetical protein ABW19_dt0201877 [Dactylella cylindrospora]